MSFNIVNRTTQTLFYQQIDQAYGQSGPSISIPPNGSIVYTGTDIPTSKTMVIRYPAGFPPTIINQTSAPSGSNLYITGADFNSKTYESSLTTSLTDPQQSVTVNVLQTTSYGQTPEQAQQQIEAGNKYQAAISNPPPSVSNPPEPDKSYTMYIILAFVLLLVIIGVFLMLKKKKADPITAFGNKLNKMKTQFGYLK